MIIGVLPKFWPLPFAMALVADVVVLSGIAFSIVLLRRAWRAFELTGEGTKLEPSCVFIDGIHPAAVAASLPAALKSAQAIMIGVDWNSDIRPKWITPILIGFDGETIKQDSVPTRSNLHFRELKMLSAMPQL